MTLPIEGSSVLWLALLFGGVFGALLHRGRVTDYNIIVNQFRLRDFTVLKVIFTAIVVGGMGVVLLHANGLASFHIKSADMLAVTLGAAIFGVGMVIYGYCPGSGVAAVATGSVHALAGFAGMLVGGILYALSFAWVRDRVLPVGSLGKARLPELTGIPEWGWLAALALIGIVGAWLLERRRSARPPAPPVPVVTATATHAAA
jgi:uncharacterized membrane protein YedE/YeeE